MKAVRNESVVTYFKKEAIAEIKFPTTDQAIHFIYSCVKTDEDLGISEDWHYKLVISWLF